MWTQGMCSGLHVSSIRPSSLSTHIHPRLFLVWYCKPVALYNFSNPFETLKSVTASIASTPRLHWTLVEKPMDCRRQLGGAASSLSWGLIVWS
jgi:hypothetical protein